MDEVQVSTQATGRRQRLDRWQRRLVGVVLSVVAAAAAGVVVPPPAAAHHGDVHVNAGGFYVSRGSVGTITPGATSVIEITSNRTLLDWSGSFTLNGADRLEFVFTTSAPDAIVLIKVNGSATIDGDVVARLSSSTGSIGGNVWFYASGGVVFGNDADVETGGLLATTANIADQGFVDGDYTFSGAAVGSEVQMAGAASITGHGGLVGFVAPSVRQDASAVVSGLSKAEVLYGGAGGFDLDLAVDGPVSPSPHLRGFVVPADWHPPGAPELAIQNTTTAATPLELNGTTAGADVFVASVASQPDAYLHLRGLDADGFAADGDGNLVVSAGAGLVRSTFGQPMHAEPTPGAPPQDVVIDGALQTSSTAAILATGSIDVTRSITVSGGAAGRVDVRAGGDISLAAALDAGAVSLAAGGDLLLTGSADIGPSWVIRAPSPEKVSGGPDSGTTALWGGGAAAAPTAPRRYVFDERRTLTFRSLDAATQSGQAAVLTSFDHDGATAFHPGVSGMFAADTAASVIGGTGPALNSTGTSAGVHPIDIEKGGLVSLAGYDFAFEDTGRLFLDPTATFASPIDSRPTLNVAKLGRVVPVKATLRAGSHVITGPSNLPAYLTVSTAACGGTATSDPVETYATAGTSTGGTLLTYDAVAQRWVHNLDTGALRLLSGSCYSVSVHFGGAVHEGTPSGGVLAGSFLLQTRR